VRLSNVVLFFSNIFFGRLPNPILAGGGDEQEHARRLRQYQNELWTLTRRHGNLWGCFATALAATLLMGVLAFRSQIPSWLAFLPAVASIFAFRSLAATATSHSRVRRLVRFYEDGAARLQGQWHGNGTGGEEYRPKKHPYATDLDLFGDGSLFELLCSARTEGGSSRLAAWLLSPAQSTEIRRRHTAVTELRDSLGLQEAWASAGEYGYSELKSSALLEWANADPVNFPAYLKALAVVLPAALLFTAASLMAGVPLSQRIVPLALLGIGEAVVASALLKQSRAVSADTVLPVFELVRLMPFFKIIEGADFKSELLQELQRSFRDGEVTPKAIIRIRLLATLSALRNSEYFAAISSIFLGGTNCAIMIERWRQEYGDGVSHWLRSLAEFDALLCLARYYYENPDHVFPIIRDERHALLSAESLGHPTLKRAECVPYDVQLEVESRPLLIVTGSNMSGKSTLLRAIGANVVLALAGAPVRATRLEISPMQVGCSVCVQDSLLDGKSRFAAETERLRQIITTANHEPTLFLLDEFLGGTNSDDRLLGAEAVIKHLVSSGSIGLLTTHDAVLAEVLSRTAPNAQNVHFRESYESGDLSFDYKIHPGIRTRSGSNPLLIALGMQVPSG
jgi:hypothetical protein